MSYINKMRGNVSIVQLVGWGLSLSVVLGGAFWTKVNATDNNLEAFKAKVADDKVEYSKEISKMNANIENMAKTLDSIDKKLK